MRDPIPIIEAPVTSVWSELHLDDRAVCSAGTGRSAASSR